MRSAICVLIMFCAGSIAFAQQTPPPTDVTTPRPILTLLGSDISPELRANRTFVPIRVIAEQFNASVRWNPAARTITLTQTDKPSITLTIGSTTVMVSDTVIRLDAAPYISQGRTMVPLRFIAQRFDIPVEYNAATRSVYLFRQDRQYVLPLPSTHAGIVVVDPRRGQLVRNPILVQGQANVFEGAVTIEVQDARGQLISRSFTTAGMGAFYPFSTQVYYNMPSEEAVDGQIVLYSPDARGTGVPLFRTVIPVRLASTR